MSRPTASELRWPIDCDESKQQALDWAEGMSSQAIDYVLRSFIQLRSNALDSIDLTQDLEQLERDLTSNHFVEIQNLWVTETDGYPSFVPHHEYPEMGTRSPAPAKPPAYDFAFVWQVNHRVAWPIEAKVLPTPKTLALYLKDTSKFIDGTAAPFSSQGSQLAYLLRGTCEEFFSELSLKLGGSTLVSTAQVAPEHRISHHSRKDLLPLSIHHLALLLVLDGQD